MKKNSTFMRLFAVLLLLPILISCNPTAPAATTPASPATTTSAEQTTTTSAETTTTTTTFNEEDPPMALYLSSLKSIMKPFWDGTRVLEESVLFRSYGEEKALLYPADQILSVTSYDGKTRYKAGVDFELRNGKIVILEGSSIPCLTDDKYYNVGDGMLQTLVNGEYVYTKYGNMHPWQVLVSYNHSSTWEGFAQQSHMDTFLPLLQRMEAGEDVTFFFYGDSITTGAEAQSNHGYHVLFTEAVAALFEYTVRYVNVKGDGISNTITNYTSEVSFGDRGTITCLNAAVGGWNSSQGVDNFDTYVAPFLRQYGCDLFINAFGMNYPAAPEQNASMHAKITVSYVRRITPNAAFLLVSTMVPNPGATNRWHINQYKQEPYFLEVANELKKDGVACEIVQMTSMSRSILTVKEFHDYSGNNINHPNDFFHRVYAQTMLQCFIGYENLLVEDVEE